GSGDVTGLSPSTNVTMPTDPDISLVRNVKATFEQIQLTVDVVGQGTVTPPGGGVTYPHTITYGSAQTVNLSASPAPGWGFKHWTGDASGTSLGTSVEGDGAKSVTAVFAQVDLTVEKEGEGTVTVTPPGGAQTPTFVETYPIHQAVFMTANPKNCWEFLR